jgi:ribonucleoside-diphosphate reductase alpha chain
MYNIGLTPDALDPRRLTFAQRMPSAESLTSRDSSSTGPIPVTQQEVVSRATLCEEHKHAFENQADAPACHECGSIMVRSGSCYRCTNCGATSGCS